MAKRAKPADASAPEADLATDPVQLLHLYRQMLLIRRFEEKAGQLYGMGLIAGFCHLYIGQEAVVVGLHATATEPGQRHHHLSRPRPHAGLRHGAARRDGRADRPDRRLFARQGRLDAHVQPREEVLWRPRHRRRLGAARRRPRLRPQVPRGRRPQLLLLRRRRVEPGAGLRGVQHGVVVEAAGDLRHREQPLRHGHLGRPRLGDHRVVPARRGVRHSRHRGRRHERPRRRRGRRKVDLPRCAPATARTSWR